MLNTYAYIKIHTYTYTYIHIHPLQSRSGGVFQVPRLSHATPLTGTTYPDHLGRGLGRDRRARNACGLPVGGAGGALWTPPTRAARACAPNWVRGWVPLWREKVIGRLPRGALSGARRVQPQRGAFWGRCAGISARLGQYIRYMQIQWTYMPKYITEYIHIHTHMHSLDAG